MIIRTHTANNKLLIYKINFANAINVFSKCRDQINKNNYLWLLLPALALFILPSMKLFSQGGSNYTLFGIGDKVNHIGAAYEGLAGTSIALPSEHAINPNNPALWSFVKTTRLQAGYKFNQQVVSNNSSTLAQNNGKMDGIFGLFVIDTSKGISVGFGIHPYTTVNYLVSVPVVVKVDGLTLDGTTLFQGSGGISQAFLGLSAKFFGNLALGGNIILDFGRITSTSFTSFPYSYTYYSSNEFLDVFSGLGFKTGLYFTGIPNIGIGAFLEKHNATDVDSKLSYKSALSPDTSFDINYDINIPLTYGFGLSYQTGKFIIGADYITQDFTNFNYRPSPFSKFKSLNQFSLGVSRIGNKSTSAEFADKMTYNFGLGYKELYYNVSGKDISEFYASFGTEMPIAGTTYLDVSLAIGSRGTTDNKLLKELFFRFNLNLSIGEIWFKPYIRE